MSMGTYSGMHWIGMYYVFIHIYHILHVTKNECYVELIQNHIMKWTSRNIIHVQPGV